MMSWDNMQPTNTTKIRNLGVVIRPNWAAIEQADPSFQPWATNLKDRTEADLSANPPALDTAYTLFCKQDSEGNPELFGINSESDVTQFTRGAALNAPNGSSFLPGGLIFKWGIFAMGEGITNIDVTYPGGSFPHSFYSVVISSTTSNSGNEAGLDLSHSNLAAFRVFRGSSPASNQSYYYMAIGN